MAFIEMTVEIITELGKIVRKMFLVHDIIGVLKGAFDIAEYDIDPEKHGRVYALIATGNYAESFLELHVVFRRGNTHSNKLVLQRIIPFLGYYR